MKKKKADADERWFGFWTYANCYFADDDGGASRRIVVCWARDDGQIIARSIKREGDERNALVRLFVDAMSRRSPPKRALVPDEATAELLRTALGSSSVRVACGGSQRSILAIEEKLDSWAFSEHGALPDTYLGRASLPLVRAFYRQVLRLWSRRREASTESFPLLVSCDELGAALRVISFDNNSGDDRVLFDVHHSVRAYRVGRGYDGPADKSSPPVRKEGHLIIDRSNVLELRDDLVTELETIGRDPRDGPVVPWLSAIDEAGVARPKTDDDYTVATMLTAGLVELFDELGPDWEQLDCSPGEREHIVRTTVEGTAFTIRFVLESPLLDPPKPIVEQWMDEFEQSVDERTSEIDIRSLETLLLNVDFFAERSGSPDLEHWEPSHLREFLLEHVVARVSIDDEEINSAVPMLVRFLHWLAETGRMPGAAKLGAEAGRLASAFVKAARSRSRWGIAKQTMTMVRERGIDGSLSRGGVIRLSDEPARDTAPVGLTSQASALPIPPAEQEAPKVGRNDPCPCGSGRKFKQCHGA